MSAPAAPPARALRLPAPPAAWLPWAPLLGIAAYAVVLIARLPGLVHDTATSDSVGPMVIAQSLPDARPGSAVVLGNAAHYTTLWFDELTRHLPGYRTIWQAAPYVLSLLSLLLLAWTVRRLAGPRAGVMAFAIGIATPPLVLVPLLSQAFHEPTFANTIVLGSLLAAMGAPPRASHLLSRLRRDWRLSVVIAMVAVITGFDAASDPLLLVTGVAPFLAAAVVLGVLRQDRRGTAVVAVAGAVSAVALAVAGVTTVVMHHAGYSVEGLSANLAGTGRMGDNATLLGHLVLDMDNGRLSLSALGGAGLLHLACGVLAVAAALVPLWLLARVKPRRRAGETDATTLFLAYWGFVAVFLALVFVATTFAVDRNSMRYLLPGFYAVAATVPFVAVRTAMRTAAVGVAVAFVGVFGAVLLQRGGADDFNVQPQHADGLVAALLAQGLDHGYSGYWQANLLTWQSDGAVLSRAVQQGSACHPKAPGWFCPYPIFTISDWYRPHPGRSFLIRELGGSFVPDLPPQSSAPIAVFSYDRFEVFVYDHDIGAEAARNANGWPSVQSSTP